MASVWVGYTEYRPVTSTTTGNIGMTPYYGTTTSYQPVQTPTYNIQLSCTINFTVVNDQVQQWRSFGNHCVGK